MFDLIDFILDVIHAAFFVCVAAFFFVLTVAAFAAFLYGVCIGVAGWLL